MDDSSLWREADTRARHVGLVSSVEGALNRHSGRLEEGTVGTSPGLVANPVKNC